MWISRVDSKEKYNESSDNRRFEKNTTKECCICGHEEKKEPEVRKFICAKCGTNLSRDINSAVNIAKKDNLLPGSNHIDWDLSQPMCIVGWNCRSCKIIKTEISSMGMTTSLALWSIGLGAISFYGLELVLW